MNNIRRKYDSLSKSEKITYLPITIIVSIVVIGLIYNSGEVIGEALYNLTH
tara:strand:+ start:2228 stop:2380 length:153 start_codon:yes stop_codon:yes gene_type:complete